MNLGDATLAAMIFYRGHGWALIALSVLVIVLANRLINGDFEMLDSPVTSIGFLITGLAVVLVGWYLNVTRPKAFAAHAAQVGPARAMKLTDEQYAASEAVQPGLIDGTVASMSREGHHTLMFLPIQIWGVAMMAFGGWMLYRQLF